MNTWQSCPKCGSSDVISRARIVDHSDSGVRDLSLSFPGGRIIGPFRMSKLVPLAALVCASCGYSELYIMDPQQLRNARDESNKAAAGAGRQYQSSVTETSFGSRGFLLIAIALAVVLGIGLVALVIIVGALGAR